MSEVKTPAQARKHLLESTKDHNEKQNVTIPVSVLRLACTVTEATANEGEGETPKSGTRAKK